MFDWLLLYGECFAISMTSRVEVLHIKERFDFRQGIVSTISQNTN